MENTRALWLDSMIKIVHPILSHGAEGTLKNALPADKKQKKRGIVYLEAIGRTVGGIAPWLELDNDAITDENEKILQLKYRDLTRTAMANAVDPTSPDYCVWNRSPNNMMQDQPIVDAAYFAGAILKAPRELWEKQSAVVQTNILRAFDLVLLMRPGRCNWLMFTALIEACKYKLTGIADSMRIDCALAMHYGWYKGDGMYGDGDRFVMNYYNSYVILPMMEEVTRFAKDIIVDRKFRYRCMRALQRYSEILERMIAPDGSFPALGRSISYRMGALHALSHAVWIEKLPKSLSFGQVRRALTKVIEKTMSAPDLFDDKGFLTKGLYGREESLAESYISCGSLYLTSVIFLPLGLAPGNKFWTSEEQRTTWEKIWSGENVEKDVALESRKYTAKDLKYYLY